jgi:hypothetical protein
LSYIKGISDSIGKALKEFGLSITYSQLFNNFEVMSYNQKDIVENNMKNGVYFIKFKTFHQLHIGETKRYLKNRVNEHKSYVKNKSVTIWPIAQHCISNNHTMDSNNAKVIKDCNNYYERKIDESTYYLKL